MAKGDIAWLLSISSVISCNGHHLGLDRTGNSNPRSAGPENPTLKRNTKSIGWPVAEIWLSEIWYITRGAFGIHLGNLGKGGGVDRTIRKSDRWWFHIGSSLWPLRYLWPFGHNLPLNVCDAQICRLVGQFWSKFGGVPFARSVMLGSAESELTVKLFLKNSNLCDQDTSTSCTANRQTTCRSKGEIALR